MFFPFLSCVSLPTVFIYRPPSSCLNPRACAAFLRLPRHIPIERAGRVPRFHSEDVKTRRREDAKMQAAPRSVAALQRCDTAKTRAAPPQRRRSVAASRHREDAKMRAAPQQRGSVPALQRCQDAKTRGDPSDLAASQRREDAKTRGDPSGVAALRSRGEIPAAWQRRSVAASRRREDESSPLSGVAVIMESLSCIFENQNANALPSFLLSFP